jgi:hypothetical protein
MWGTIASECASLEGLGNTTPLSISNTNINVYQLVYTKSSPRLYSKARSTTVQLATSEVDPCTPNLGSTDARSYKIYKLHTRSIHVLCLEFLVLPYSMNGLVASQRRDCIRLLSNSRLPVRIRHPSPRVQHDIQGSITRLAILCRCFHCCCIFNERFKITFITATYPLTHPRSASHIGWLALAVLRLRTDRQKHSGRLVKVPSNEAKRFLSRFLQANNYHTYHIGMDLANW